MLKFVKIILIKSLFCALLATSLPGYAQESLSAEEQVEEAIDQNITSQVTSLEGSFGRDELKDEDKPEIIDQRPSRETSTTTPFKTQFKLKKITLVNNTTFNDGDLQSLFSSYLNRQVSFVELQEITRLITNHYRSKGYITSRAYLPPQKIQDGNIAIRIIEGKIDKVTVQENKHFSKKFYYSNINFNTDQIFKYQDLETNLSRLNQIKDVRTKAYLLPGDLPETSSILLKVEEKNPIHFYYDFNNRGTRFTHLSRHTFRMSHNSVTGIGDKLNVGYLLVEEGAVGSAFLSYEYPFNNHLSKFKLSFSHTNSMLVKHLKPFEIKGKSTTITPSITHNVYKNTSTSVNLYTALEFKDSKSSIDDFKLSFDRMRVFVAGPELTYKKNNSLTSLKGLVHLGIPNFIGGSKENDLNTTRTNTGGKFTYYTFSASHYKRLANQTLLTVRGRGQWTRDSLTSLEQIRGGGAYSVRGYPESDSSGDYGYQLTTEIKAPIPGIPEAKLPFLKKTLNQSLKGVLFYDMSKIFIRERERSTQEKDRLLLGAGIGLRLQINESTHFSIDWAFPFGDPSIDEDRNRIHFNLTVGY